VSNISFASNFFRDDTNSDTQFLLVAISCIGWVTNHFVGTKFPNQSDISAAVGAFAVGLVSNLYGRFFEGNAFVVMVRSLLLVFLASRN
jgi:uncharacterized membrane protein YjjB (DUF3815 family)